jgi:hypothetical protein
MVSGDVTVTSEPGKGIGVYGAPARKRRQLTKDFKMLLRSVLICCTALRRDGLPIGSA